MIYCISDFCSGILNLCSLSDAAAAEAAACVLVRVPVPRRATGEEGGKGRGVEGGEQEEEEGMEGEKLKKKFQEGVGINVKRARKQEGVAREQEGEQEGAEKVAQSL